MAESLDAFSEIRAIRARVEGIEHRQELIVRAHRDEILAAVWESFDRDFVLAEVYISVDGKRNQHQIVADLASRGIETTQQNVSLKLQKLMKEMALVEAAGKEDGTTVYRKTEVERIFHLTQRVERRLVKLRREKEKRAKPKSGS
jgi:hypothetical protein